MDGLGTGEELDYRGAFWLATLGGAQALGLEVNLHWLARDSAHESDVAINSASDSFEVEQSQSRISFLLEGTVPGVSVSCSEQSDLCFFNFLSCLKVWVQDTIGSFEVGKEFDALMVDPTGGACFDTFTGDTSADVFQKFINLGDDRNIRAVWVQGGLVLWK